MTTKHTHTPGPWYVSDPFEVFPGAELRFHISQDEEAPYTPEYSDVANLSVSTIPGEKLEIQRANACLIAAAPELLEALRAFTSLAAQRRDELGELSPEMEAVDAQARAAILKATGEQA